MNKYILALSLLVLPATVFAKFSDVSGTPYDDGIDYVQKQKIVEGYNDGTFKPNKTINRAEFTKILVKAMYDPLTIVACDVSSLTYSDVSMDDWFGPYVCVATKEGIVQGYDDGTFRPGQEINLAEASKIIAGIFHLQTDDSGSGSVKTGPVWYAPYVKSLSHRKAIPIQILAVGRPITRGQMAEMVYRLKANVQDRETKTLDELEEGSTAASTDNGLLPLGDKKLSNSPKVGYIYSCQTQFNGRGAFRDGDWIQGNYWTTDGKPTVDGSNTWSQATFTIREEGDNRMITGNGLPVDTTTGTYPVAQSDDAYNYDRNPNSIKAQQINLTLPKSPVFANSPSCVPMGMIGVALNGVAIFNGFDAEGRDAPAHEIQDICNGHPQQAGMYHYHNESSCLGDTNADGQSPLLGYALDGFGIYGKYDTNGNELTSADLDECHGTTSEVEWNGTMQTIYHYVFTDDYPYTIGCFRGTPVSTGGLGNDAGSEGMMRQRGPQGQGQMGPGMNGPQGRGRGMGPPSEAKDACENKAEEASCSFQGQQGRITGMCRTVPEGDFACVPQ